MLRERLARRRKELVSFLVIVVIVGGIGVASETRSSLALKAQTDLAGLLDDKVGCIRFQWHPRWVTVVESNSDYDCDPVDTFTWSPPGTTQGSYLELEGGTPIATGWGYAIDSNPGGGPAKGQIRDLAPLYEVSCTYIGEGVGRAQSSGSVHIEAVVEYWDEGNSDADLGALADGEARYVDSGMDEAAEVSLDDSDGQTSEGLLQYPATVQDDGRYPDIDSAPVHGSLTVETGEVFHVMYETDLWHEVYAEMGPDTPGYCTTAVKSLVYVTILFSDTVD